METLERNRWKLYTEICRPDKNGISGQINRTAQEPEKQTSYINMAFKYKGAHKRPMKQFLLYLRDASRISPEVIPDTVLASMIKKWDSEEFEDALEEIAHNTGDEASGFGSHCYFAAQKLAAHGVAISLLLEKMEAIQYNHTETRWDSNDALLISLRENRSILVAPADIIGIRRISGPDDLLINRARMNCGLIVPNPIWNESVIDRLEFLINKKDVLEADLDLFFRMYPSFVLDDLHCSISPQVVLLSENDNSLRPDFILQRAGNEHIDILEIKRPNVLLVTGSDNRPALSRDMARAIAQLKEYREWFHSSSNRKLFREQYGLEGYEPALTLIVGRNSAFRNQKVKHRVLEGQSVNVLTYDDILNIAWRRRKNALLG